MIDMAANQRAGSSDLPDWMQQPVLKLPLSEATLQISNLVEAGERLRGRIKIANDFDEVKRRVEQWRGQCRRWLDRNLGGQAADEFKTAALYDDEESYFAGRPHMEANLDQEVGTLADIAERLPQLVSSNTSTAERSVVSPPDGPIFIVHGHDTLRAERVARIVKEATGRQTIILREQANLGQTLIEKFERHATKVSYAIVVLTPDDEGGPRNQIERSPRGRQNVIFEMGYFYGALGRDRVSVLLQPGVEKPSDVDGIVYIGFDDNGAWKIDLFRELEHAGIRVDISQAI